MFKIVEPAEGWRDGRTDRQTIPTTLSPCFAKAMRLITKSLSWSKVVKSVLRMSCSWSYLVTNLGGTDSLDQKKSIDVMCLTEKRAKSN